MAAERPPTCYLHHHVKPCPRCEEIDAGFAAATDDSPGDLSLDDYLDRMVAGTLSRPGREELATVEGQP